MDVSVLILTYNEEATLPECLAALDWCDDIVVLDSGSTDATLAIAAHFGARVLTRSFDTFADQRNFGLDHGAFKYDWVLHLDSDEVVTPEFKVALSQLLPKPDIDAYYVPSKLILFGQWLRRSGMYPTYQARLGHRDRLRFIQVGHGQRESLPASRLGVFSEPYLHYSFAHGLRHWLEKHIRYAHDEAQLIIATRACNGEVDTNDSRGGTGLRRRVKLLAARYLPLPLRPFSRFIYVYLWRRGFLDGRAGLAYAIMLSVFEGMTATLAMEMEQLGRVPRSESTSKGMVVSQNARDHEAH